MDSVKVIVEAVSIKNNGIMVGGKWFTVVGQATNFMPQKNDEIELTLNEKNEAIFIQIIHRAKQEEKPVPETPLHESAKKAMEVDFKELVLDYEKCLKEAIKIVKEMEKELVNFPPSEIMDLGISMAIQLRREKTRAW